MIGKKRMNKKYTKKEIMEMDYVDFLALLNETNRPPGGKDSIRRMAINSFLTENSSVLHSGCNTGYCSFEITHLTKCKTTAIDINENMVDASHKKLKKEPEVFRKKISFHVADAHNLAFKDNSFDLVFSAGSTAFMKNPSRVVCEHKRVCKPYGFVGDICIYYKKKAPVKLLNNINKLLKIEIKPWNKNYWVSLYQNEELELYYDFTDNMPYHPNKKEVSEYCEKMVKNAFFNQPPKITEAAIEKLFGYMSLFNENHKYIAYSVLIFRKDVVKEQVTLFGK